MGKIVDNDQFISHLSQMYAGTKKWGTVRVLIKRCNALHYVIDPILL